MARGARTPEDNGLWAIPSALGLRERECKKPLCSRQRVHDEVLWGTPRYVCKGEGTPDPGACVNLAFISSRANVRGAQPVGTGTFSPPTGTVTGECSVSKLQRTDQGVTNLVHEDRCIDRVIGNKGTAKVDNKGNV